MSIETLLEAAKFLELQAQQQQKARGMFAFYKMYGTEEKRAVIRLTRFLF